MRAFGEPNYVVVQHILDLLPTIEEALEHMRFQLDELRLEEAAVLFKDSIEGIGIIVYSANGLADDSNSQSLLVTLTELRRGIAAVNDGFERNDLRAIQGALTLRLIPAYMNWQKELLQILLPTVVM